MKKGISWLCVLLAGVLVQAAEPAPQPRHATLAGKVMCGYQGWFRTPSDAAQAGWRHYLRQRDGVWLPTTDYVAMFDEVDEGTQIFKVNSAPPAGEGFAYQTYGALPSDHYLWLTGEAARQFRSGQSQPESMPARK
jgi:hypothetical protein